MSIEKQPSKRIVSESPRNRIFTSEKQQKQITNQQPLLFWKIGLYICFQIKTTLREGNSFLIIYSQHNKTFKNSLPSQTDQTFQSDLNPLSPMSDQDRISPYNINTISRRQVMRIKKNIS